VSDRDATLLALVLEGIASDRIPLSSVDDLAALYHWLTVIRQVTPDVPSTVRQMVPQ
jgi:hypothetical protein